MWLIDLILNIAALLLWLKWLEQDVSSVISQPRVSVVANLRRATPRYPRTVFLAALLTLLSVRGLFYWLLGSATDWIAKLYLGPIPLYFRSGAFPRIFLYSFLSFGFALAIFYSALLLLSLINPRLEDDPVHKVVRTHLGWVEAWPLALKLLAPWVATLILWCVLNPSGAKSFTMVFQKGAVAALGVYLIWKYVLIVLLVAYVLNSYIYFGAWPLWTYVEKNGQRILALLRWIPLRAGKIDFSPAVALALVILVGELATRGLLALYQRF